ncbi:hypothetical protein A2810_01775 [candidate division Kazan bacterium RIFCSPHIGHO2_01_FULL_49_10]|uniref:DUF5667 domain-containing protein n=1 Tax=candidate division Kazan bacterium RIFCSPLOWO2_01_FULL_48_13 TaxID=1798539 RepID=A0A1F4PN47_UNCK3|nr:MAG: hypothetical protein A2810_01775 [candidate division Kazan bacterium RIFCSPHIGHO2_01_FULL_49_10]OGB85030.1 MAG: hypothetical protein A2994_00225 [candidate division Kazan bacterium RIFCSPLOWO2_01_FULL_48_13]
MTSNQFEQLENTLKTLGNRADLSFSKKQVIRDKVFQAIGQVELADAIVEGESKAKALFVSIKSLQKALIPHRLSFSMPVTMVTMLIVFLGSLVTGVAAQGAGPSDTLFWAKKVLEKVEIAFATNPISKAKVTIDIATERLKYLEGSVGEEQTLSKVLRESQVALVSAKAALKKAQENNQNTSGVEELVNRFSALLNDQRTLLTNIEQGGAGDEVKKTVVAIREALKEAEKPVKSDTTTSTSVAAKPVEATVPAESPTLSGRLTTTGRFGTSSGQVVLFVGSKFYQIISAPTALSQLVGSTVMLTGEFAGDQVNILQLSANGIVYGNLPQ